MNSEQFKEKNNYKTVKCCYNCISVILGFKSVVIGCKHEREADFEGLLIENSEIGYCDKWGNNG